MQRQITVTVTVSTCDLHPLKVNVKVNAELDPREGWFWEVEKINWVELVVGDKEGVDITRQITSNNRAYALLIASAADCNEQIYEALAEKEEAYNG